MFVKPVIVKIIMDFVIEFNAKKVNILTQSKINVSQYVLMDKYISNNLQNVFHLAIKMNTGMEDSVFV